MVFHTIKNIRAWWHMKRTGHLPDCWAGKGDPCPAPNTLHSEKVGEHWWSGWPGAHCMKCGTPDAQEMCMADDCLCRCHGWEDMSL